VAGSTELRDIAIQHGRAKKRNNAIVALLSGALPGAIFSLYLPFSWERWLLGLMVGLIWGNAFEYAYHRWLLHRPRSAIGKGHREHHAQVGTPEEAEHVTLGSSPLNVAILFAINGAVAIPMDFLLGLHILGGIFTGWTIYIISAEEIHWRIHMDGWLPRWLQFARAYHMSHHDVPNSCYNVFLPLFDWLLRNSAQPASKIPA
jgi:hypothetical protein